MNEVLVFTIATNGYDEIFKEYIASQEDYAKSQGYDFLVFRGRPKSGISGSDSAWLKVPLILKALNEGYRKILFLDSDCMVMPHTPPIESMYKRDGLFYMAKDGREDIFNTGVMMIINDDRTIKLFRRILNFSDVPGFFFPKRFQALYEMGHIVYFSRDKQWLKEIERKWNDNTNEVTGHYVLHAHGMYHKKPRSKESEVSVSKSLRNKVISGSRCFRLKKLSNWFWEKSVMNK